MTCSETYKKIDVWSLLLRLYHWMFAISIVGLVVTGFYINDPWTAGTLEGSGSAPVACMRYIHFVFGYTFASAILIRFYLLLFGNKQERIGDILPVTKRNIKNLISTLALYTYISNKHDERPGHNVVAGLVYLLTFLVAIFQIISGFYMLFPETVFWQKAGLMFFGPQQDARFFHHFLMWYFIVFVLVHVYLTIWNDLNSPDGIISSIFTGKKFKPGPCNS